MYVTQIAGRTPVNTTCNVQIVSEDRRNEIKTGERAVR